MQFNKTNLKIIRADIDAALASVEAKHGIKFNLGNIRFSDNDFRGKLECNSVADASGNAINPAEVHFNDNRWRVGLARDAFGKTFRSNGRTFTIVGVNTRAKKYPVKATDPNGGMYKFPMSSLPANLKS